MTPPTAAPNMSKDIATTSMNIEITSSHPARTSERNNLRLITVTDRKMNTPSIDNASMSTVRYGLMSLRISMGLVSASGRDDQAHNVSAIIMNTAVIIAVITVDLIISLLSEISSLTVVYTDLGNREFMFHS